MRDYESTLNQARTCAKRKYCDIGANCEYYDAGVCCQGGEKDILNDAADAIEELVAAVRSVVHCKDCKWCHAGYCEKYDDLIPWGCANKPWEDWFCADGKRREIIKEEQDAD